MLSVILFIAPGCPHCSAVLQTLSELIKAGDIAQLEITNMAIMPEKAQQYAVRSVPWIKIGPFELSGAHSKGELQQWIQRAQSETGMQHYFNELLSTGKLDKVTRLLKKEPELFRHLPDMLSNKETPLGAKIGIGAIFEEFQGQEAIQAIVPLLIGLLSNSQASVRNDASYYLGLSESPEAIDALKSLLNDPQEEIRESARDALEIIALAN